MNLEKSTTLAGLVWVAGVLAAILFQNVFASSRMGVILGILLAIVILIATYFAIDGIRIMIQTRSDTEILQQQAYEDKMIELMQHEIQGKMVETMQQEFEELQKGYADIKREYGELQQEYTEIKQEYTEIRQEYGELQQEFQELIGYEKSTLDTLGKLEESTKNVEATQAAQIAQAEQAAKEAGEKEDKKENVFDTKMLDDMADTINKTTMQAAKLIVQYSNKASHDLEGKIDNLTEEIAHISHEE
ncbi:MAG: hypothetical protein J1E62_09685 [Lachnospiraceae bacterium]|nr:hypothetical protein [Lachnospiraceae bacterium]